MNPGMNKPIAFLAVVATSLLLASCGKEQSENEPILIKFPHVTAPGTPKGRAADRFRDLVHERMGGRVVVEVYPSGQLMNDDDSIDALAFGEVQMIATSLSKFDRITHRFQIFDLPFLFPDLKAVERFQASEHGQSLLEVMTDRGLKGLAFWHNGMKQFGAPVAMRRPADAEGLKFRIMESDVLQAQILQIGGNPQKMDYSEVYQALQTGAVDAQENTWSNLFSSKLFEVQDYLTETNHGYIGYLVTVNPDFWDTLPPDVQDELAAIVREVAAWANAEAESVNRDGKQKIMDAGGPEVVTLSASELSGWRQALRPVWDQFADTIGADLIAAAEAMSN
jgi:C4-dicarboxylate-binding protein DctP